MITDRQLAEACAATYVGAKQSWGTDTVHVFLSEAEDGTHVIAFEGTQSPREWMIDILGAMPEITTCDHDVLGIVHKGWYLDVMAVRDQIINYMLAMPDRAPFAITGHSKGAAEALIFAAECVSHGIVPVRVTTFGTPRPGLLADLLADIAGADYRNNDDPVWDVPPYLPRAGMRMEKHIHIPPMDFDPWGPLADHHMALYLAGAGG